jgi:predicted small lipoprotein YifL
MTPSRPPVPISLDAVDVAAPCTESWDAMTGDDRSRFCGSCRLHVYDLSSMTRDAAEEFVRTRKQGGGSVCVRLVRRADGTVVTDDCGPVRGALRRRALRVRAAAVGALAFLFSMAACGREPPAAAPAAVKPRESKPAVAPARSDPIPAAPSAQPAPAPPDAVAPPSPSPPAPPDPPKPPEPPEPPRTETIGKI